MPHRAIPRLNRTRAKTLRQSMTDAEQRLWYRLRAHRLSGASFRRQFPIGRYIVDFVCLDARVIVELDGGQHADSIKDAARDGWLRSQGFKVLRFWNNDVLSNTNGVVQTIADAVSSVSPPSLNLPRKGGGKGSEQGATE